MLPPLADLDDVEARMGRPVPDAPQAVALIEDASAIVRAFANRTWVDGGGNLADVPDGVPGVVAGMVRRALDNPGGVVSHQQTTGPFNESVNYGPDASQRLFLTWADKLLLRGSSQAFTVDPTPAAAPVSPLTGALVNGPHGQAPGES